MKKIFCCPFNEWNYPYYNKGLCTMYPKSNPIKECEDFYFFCGNCEEEDFTVNFEEIE